MPIVEMSKPSHMLGQIGIVDRWTLCINKQNQENEHGILRRQKVGSS